MFTSLQVCKVLSLQRGIGTRPAESAIGSSNSLHQPVAGCTKLHGRRIVSMKVERRDRPQSARRGCWARRDRPFWVSAAIHWCISAPARVWHRRAMIGSHQRQKLSRLVRFARSTHQPVRLHQHAIVSRLRPQRKADDDKGDAKHQTHYHHAPVGRSVCVVKRWDHRAAFALHPKSKLRTDFETNGSPAGGAGTSEIGLPGRPEGSKEIGFCAERADSAQRWFDCLQNQRLAGSRWRAYRGGTSSGREM